MSELLNGIFECLDIDSSTGLATEDSLQSMKKKFSVERRGSMMVLYNDCGVAVEGKQAFVTDKEGVKELYRLAAYFNNQLNGEAR